MWEKSSESETPHYIACKTKKTHGNTQAGKARLYRVFMLSQMQTDACLFFQYS